MAIATDTEEPNPVLFPAVKAQGENDYFTFPLIPLRNPETRLLTYTRIWLASGLETFGLGAKTNAGYGWFDASETLNQAIVEQIKIAKKRREDDLQSQRDKERQDAEAAIRLAAKAALEQALAGLSPEEREDKKIEMLSVPQFEAKIRSFCKDIRKGGPGDEEKKAIVRALRGTRIAYWQEFKIKADKGGDAATIGQAIRALSKTMSLGKMP
jgi:hypothetical protein